ncbi:MAG: lysylphosphatidylglycerol synthase domain-containing protein [bacterium]
MSDPVDSDSMTGTTKASSSDFYRSGRLGRILRVAGVLIAIVAVGVCVRTLVDEWSSIRTSIVDADVRWLLTALVASAAAMTGLGLLWWRCLLVFGSLVRRRDALAWYFGGELGKYLPGGIWPVLGRGELAARSGVNRSAAYVTTLISYAAMCVGAAIACALLAPVIATSGGGLGWGWAMLLLIPVGVSAVHPAVLRPVLNLGRRLTRGRVHPTPPSWPTMLGLIARAVPTWILVGAGAAAVTAALGYHQHPAQVAFAAIVAWILGFLAVPVPAGAGLRELIFVLLAGLPSSSAVAVAAVSRLMFIVVDAVGAAIGLWWVRRSTRTRRGSRIGQDHDRRNAPSPPEGTRVEPDRAHRSARRAAWREMRNV